MIIDTTSEEHDKLSNEFGFNPWQRGLFADMINMKNLPECETRKIKSVNMGRSAGHTYFAKHVSLQKCPVRTKVYTTNHSRLGEFARLILNPGSCHEMIDVLYDKGFAGYNGSHVDAVIVDLCNEPVKHHRRSLEALYCSIPKSTSVIILEPKIL